MSGNKNVHRGMKVLSIAYNWMGLIGVKACFNSFRPMILAKEIGMRSLTTLHFTTFSLTALFFISSFLLIDFRKEGLLIPIFLLTFLITGGFVILLPLFIIHLLYTSRSSVIKKFV